MARLMKKQGQISLQEAYQKAMLWFFAFPDQTMSLSDLAAKLNISKTTANHAVAKLKGEGFLEVKEFGRAWGITCRKGHAYHYSKKIAYNLLLVYASSIVEEVKRAVQNPLSIALFGSYRKGDDNEHSDIDIAVEVLGSKELEIIELGTFPLFGYRKNVKLNLHVFSRKKVDSNLFANIANGIVLDGFLEAKP